MSYLEDGNHRCLAIRLTTVGRFSIIEPDATFSDCLLLGVEDGI